MGLEDSKVVLFDTLISHKGLQALMDTCSELLGNPAVLSDMGMHIVCKSESCSQFPDVFHWTKSVEGEADYAKKAARSGYFEQIYKQDKPVRGNIDDKPPFYFATRVRDGSNLLGNLLVAECNRPLTADEHLLPFPFPFELLYIPAVDEIPPYTQIIYDGSCIQKDH